MRLIKIALVSIILLILLPAHHTLAAGFSDVPKSFWGVTEVEYLHSKGIINGYGNGKFAPNNQIKRADAAIMIAKSLDLNTNNRPALPFKDVSSNHYAYDYIAAVVDEGIFQKADQFRPNAPLKRGEMAKVLVEAFALKGGQSVAFKDTPTSHWAYRYISTLAGYSITAGYPDATFKPNNNITRAEFSALLARVQNDEFKPEVNILPHKIRENIYYPQVYGNIDSQAKKRMNDTFLQHARKAESFYQELKAELGQFGSNMYDVQSTYEVKYNQDGKISVLFNDYAYEGGAHGLYWLTAFNFDIKSGSQLKLKDLFAPNTDYVRPINTEIKKQISIWKKQDSGRWLELRPFNSIEADTEQFYLTPQGIGIYFGLYDYTAYASGIPTFLIPYSAAPPPANPPSGDWYKDAEKEAAKLDREVTIVEGGFLFPD